MKNTHSEALSSLKLALDNLDDTAARFSTAEHLVETFAQLNEARDLLDDVASALRDDCHD